MRLIVMSDLHLAKKPWQVRKAFCMGKDAVTAYAMDDGRVLHTWKFDWKKHD